MKRREGWALVLGLTLAMTACSLGGSRSEAASTVDAYLSAVRGGATDRGWSLLAEELREEAFADEQSYRRLAEAADWSGFTWTVEDVVLDDPTLAIITLALPGADAPTFLSDSGAWSIIAPNPVGTKATIWVRFTLAGARIWLSGG
jgi:hypothetical protein